MCHHFVVNIVHKQRFCRLTLKSYLRLQQRKSGSKIAHAWRSNNVWKRSIIGRDGMDGVGWGECENFPQTHWSYIDHPGAARPGPWCLTRTSKQRLQHTPPAAPGTLEVWRDADHLLKGACWLPISRWAKGYSKQVRHECKLVYDYIRTIANKRRNVPTSLSL